jgi:hypothetical protein
LAVDGSSIDIGLTDLGVIADDDPAFDVDGAGAGEATVRTHGKKDWAGFVEDDDF